MLPFKKSEDENLWAEEHSSAADAARSVVRRARLRATTLAPSLPRLAREIEAFASDLLAIEDIYTKDPSAFRKVRALTAVHLPSIISSLDTLCTLRNGGADEHKMTLIEDDVRACLSAASQARAVLTSGAITTLEIEAATLRAAIAPGTEHAEPPHQPPSTDAPRGQIAGRLAQITKARGLKVGNVISGAYEQGRAHMATAGQAASDRVSAGASLAARYAGDLLEDGVDYLTSPLTRRISAVGFALQSASITALAGGVASALIFPPAIPVAIGVALLDGTHQYGRALQDAEETGQAEKAQRQEERDHKRTALLKRLRGQSPLVRMETPHVHVTLNPDSGNSQGLILTGKYTGADMASLPIETLTRLGATAPDPETREIILAFRNRMKAHNGDPIKGMRPSTRSADASDIAMSLVDLGLSTLS